MRSWPKWRSSISRSLFHDWWKMELEMVNLCCFSSDADFASACHGEEAAEQKCLWFTHRSTSYLHLWNGITDTRGQNSFAPQNSSASHGARQGGWSFLFGCLLDASLMSFTGYVRLGHARGTMSPGWPESTSGLAQKTWRRCVRRWMVGL